MNLSTKGRYGVMAMIDMASKGEEAVVPLSSISQNQQLPITYLEQLFNKLRRRGLVESVRGAGGGYKLAKPASDITIACIMLAVGETFKTTRCAGDNAKGCMDKGLSRCKTHDLWVELGKVINFYLSSVTLEDVINKRACSLTSSFVVPLPSQKDQETALCQ